MMKKLLGIVVFSLLLSSNAYSDNHLILIQCKDDRPEMSLLQPIYEINLETKKVKVGMKEMIVHRGTTETEIVLVNSNSVMAEVLRINRNTGRFVHKKRFFAISTGKEEDEKKFTETGVCVKKTKAF